MSNTYIVTVVLRHAITAQSEKDALEVVNDQYKELAEDGSLSDFLVYEWENAVCEGIENPFHPESPEGREWETNHG